MATVKEIQVCGGVIHHSLVDVCLAYIKCVTDGTDREKLHFYIVLPNGETKSITFRQDGDMVVAYGDFDGLPSALEWAQGTEWEGRDDHLK